MERPCSITHPSPRPAPSYSRLSQEPRSYNHDFRRGAEGFPGMLLSLAESVESSQMLWRLACLWPGAHCRADTGEQAVHLLALPCRCRGLSWLRRRLGAGLSSRDRPVQCTFLGSLASARHMPPAPSPDCDSRRCLQTLPVSFGAVGGNRPWLRSTTFYLTKLLKGPFAFSCVSRAQQCSLRNSE